MKNRMKKMNETLDVNKHKNKNIKIIIIILIIILFIIGCFFGIYYTTDIFKTDKEIFTKYMAKALSEEKGFIEKDLQQYIEKKKTTPYSNNGTITNNMDIPETIRTNEEEINKFSVDFNGQVDKANKKMNEYIKLNYDSEKDVNVPVNIRMVNNKFGVQTDYISKKYITLDLNKTEDLFGKDKNELIQKNINGTNDINDEEMQHLIDVYGPIIDKHIDNSKFSKTKENNETICTFKLIGSDLKEIYNEFFEALKTDDLLLDELQIKSSIEEYNNQLSKYNIKYMEEYTVDSYIDEIKENLSDLINEDQVLQIDIKINKKQVNSININYGEFNIKIEKNENTKEKLLYSIFVKAPIEDLEETFEIEATIEYNKLKEMNNVDEKYDILIRMISQTKDEVIVLDNKINNNVNFINQVEVPELKNEDSIMLTDYSQADVTNYANEILERIKEVDKNKIDEAGMSISVSPILYSIPFVNITAIVTQQSLDYFEDTFLKGSTSTIDAMREEVSDRINTALNGIYAQILMEEDISNIKITEIKEDFFSENQEYKIEFDKDENIVITWTPSDESYGDPITGKIIKQKNGETATYTIEPAKK